MARRFGGALESVRNWNQFAKIGTEVVYEGKVYITESLAALGQGGVPVVFLGGIEEPVPLDRLRGQDWVFTVVRKGKKNEQRGN